MVLVSRGMRPRVLNLEAAEEASGCNETRKTVSPEGPVAPVLRLGLLAVDLISVLLHVDLLALIAVAPLGLIAVSMFADEPYATDDPYATTSGTRKLSQLHFGPRSSDQSNFLCKLCMADL